MAVQSALCEDRDLIDDSVELPMRVFKLASNDPGLMIGKIANEAQPQSSHYAILEAQPDLR